MDDLGLTIHFLGTGSASPNANRDNSSLLIVAGERAVMVDVSGYPGRKLPQLGIGFERLTDLVLTHAHIDHVYAFPSLVASMVSVAGETPAHLKVHGRAPVLDVARQLLAPFAGEGRTASRLTVDYLPMPDSLTELDINLGTWRISGFPVNHGDVPAIGLILEHKNGARVVYSGDAEADDCIAAQLMENTLCLIHDCASGMAVTARTVGHAGAQELHALLQRVPQPKQVVITHLSARQDGVLPDMLSLLREDYRGEVCAAQDGMTIKL